MAVLGLAAYAAFLAALTPASFVAARIEEATRGGLQLRDASGTIWNGKAAAVVATPAGPFAIDELQWRFLPARLLGGVALFAVEANTEDLKVAGEAGRGLGAWKVPTLAASGTAAGTASFLPLLAAWRPAGNLAIEASDLELRESELRGTARIRWSAAALGLSDVRPLGTYVAELRGEGGPAKITLTTVDGPLRITGGGTFSPPVRIAFKGEARAEGAAAAQLQPLLDLIGPRRADGARTIDVIANAP